MDRATCWALARLGKTSFVGSNAKIVLIRDRAVFAKLKAPAVMPLRRAVKDV